MKSIVVGIDGSAGSAEALRWAVEEARLHDAHVTAVRCWGGRDHLSREGWSEELAEAERRADEELRALVAGAVPNDADIVDTRTLQARPEWGLLDVSADTDLLVVGARGVSGIRGLVVGSVSQQLIHHAHVPVAVVRHTRWPVLPRRVVVGVDGSPGSLRAVEWAVEEGHRRQAEVEAVMAWSTPILSARADDEQVVQGRLAEALDQVDTSVLEQPVRRTVIEGSPGPTICDVASGAEVVVVGSRGLGGFKELLIGSVGQHVAHHAPCPVIVVRSDATKRR
jgi:nucleotide-binding universal stress UspA family protein